MLREVNITGDAFTEQMSPAPLHWMLADQASCYVVEAVEEGVKIYPNPIGVLTNNPPFPFHLDYIRNFCICHRKRQKISLQRGWKAQAFRENGGLLLMEREWEPSGFPEMFRRLPGS